MSGERVRLTSDYADDEWGFYLDRGAEGTVTCWEDEGVNVLWDGLQTDMFMRLDDVEEIRNGK